jgi:hypothetical protein
VRAYFKDHRENTGFIHFCNSYPNFLLLTLARFLPSHCVTFDARYHGRTDEGGRLNFNPPTWTVSSAPFLPQSPWPSSEPSPTEFTSSHLKRSAAKMLILMSLNHIVGPGSLFPLACFWKGLEHSATKRPHLSWSDQASQAAQLHLRTGLCTP